MPEISRFYGIIIKMYFLGKEHNPPHIHAFYNDFVAVIDINNLKIIEGDLPKTAQKLVINWIKINKEEIEKMWENQEIKKIKPLK